MLNPRIQVGVCQVGVCQVGGSVMLGSVMLGSVKLRFAIYLIRDHSPFYCLSTGDEIRALRTPLPWYPPHGPPPSLALYFTL